MTEPERGTRPKRRNIRPLHLVAAAVLIAAGFIWGWGYVKHYWFPYSLIRKARSRIEGDPVLFSNFSASGGTSFQKSSPFSEIASLPYVGAAERSDAGKNGPPAKLLVPEKSFAGLNLFTLSTSDEAYLIDMQGNLLRKWELPRSKIQWDSPIAGRQGFSGWRSVHTDPHLNLFVIYDYLGLAKLDARSNVIWLNRNGAHHSLYVAGNGDVYTLTSRMESVPDIHPSVPVITDAVAVIDPSGRLKAEYSILEIVRNSGYGYLLPSVAHQNSDYPIDIFHTNSIEVLDGSGEGVSPVLFKKGNVLLSLRNISAIMIVDLEEKAVRWLWGPSNISYQHTPRIVPGPHILLFDNGISRSSVLEVDPLTCRIHWNFTGEGPLRLASRIFGACQMLPNGNVLITDSLQSRALEVTKDGEVVWIFEPKAADNSRIPALFEMYRYSPEYFGAGTVGSGGR